MENLEIERIRQEYLQRLRKMLRRAPADIREDALREVQSHIEDEWQSLGGGGPALISVLERLGPPEEYGRDLALQLMLMRGRELRSPLALVWAAIFWAGTSLIGSILLLASTFVLLYTLGMLVVALVRLGGQPGVLVRADSFQWMGYYTENLVFPPLSWSPALTAAAGLLPLVVIFFSFYRFLSLWLRSRLAGHGLAVVTRERASVLPRGWERNAIFAMLIIAVLSLTSCFVSSVLSNFLPVGRPGSLSLPEDFFRTPLTLLVFISMVVFLCSPVLGLLWAARRTRHE